MTPENKKQRKYLRSVRRHLKLPADVRDRVMSDLESSLAVRLESGQSMEGIIGELGQPRQAAAELNEQMKEFAYVPSRWRWAALAVTVIGVVMIVFNGISGLLTWMLNLSIRETASLGVIGGADGPTAIFVTSNFSWSSIFVWAIVILMGIIGFRKLSRCKP